SRLECGCTSLQWRRHVSMVTFASARERNHFVCLQAAKTCWLATDSANFNVRSTWANFGASERAAFRGSAFLDANRILRSGEAGHELLVKSVMMYRWAHDQAT